LVSTSQYLAFGIEFLEKNAKNAKNVGSMEFLALEFLAFLVNFWHILAFWEEFFFGIFLAFLKLGSGIF